MDGSIIKITGLEVTREAHMRRARFQEIVEVLGAQVAQNDSRRPWTHVVCVNASHLDVKILEKTRRRQIPLVTVQWILDSYMANARLSTDSYAVESMTSPSSAAAPSAPTAPDVTINLATNLQRFDARR